MLSDMQYSINVGGHLLELSTPQVMGILNVTPDSFYAESRVQTEEAIRRRVIQILNEGGCIIDVGAFSTRPGANDVSKEEEMNRLRTALKTIRQEAPDAILSVDTFRADVAKMCVEEYGVQMVNDISCGQLDAQMFATVAKLGVPYILMHGQGTVSATAQMPHYEDLMKEILLYFAERIQQLRDLGQKDIILDPGFGFGKTLEQNYELLANVDALRIFELPILVGVSRKSMIYKLLNTSAEHALNGTSVLNTIALTKDCAQILRVHDVREAVEAVSIVSQTDKYRFTDEQI